MIKDGYFGEKLTYDVFVTGSTTAVNIWDRPFFSGNLKMSAEVCAEGGYGLRNQIRNYQVQRRC